MCQFIFSTLMRCMCMMLTNGQLAALSATLSATLSAALSAAFVAVAVADVNFFSERRNLVRRRFVFSSVGAYNLDFIVHTGNGDISGSSCSDSLSYISSLTFSFSHKPSVVRLLFFTKTSLATVHSFCIISSSFCLWCMMDALCAVKNSLSTTKRLSSLAFEYF